VVPIAILVTLTEAPWITAFAESVTVPVMVPRDSCARAEFGSTKAAIKIAISNQHALAQKSTVSPEEVATLPFILYERKTVMRRLIDQFFAGIGVDPKIVMVMENIEAIKSLVGAGLGASVLPEHAVSSQGDDTRVRLISVDNHPLRRHLGLVTLKSEFATAAVRAMSDLLSAELGKPG